LPPFGAATAWPYYFSVHDTLEIAKAVMVAELLTCLVLFTVTRMEGIPRTTPIIHALVLSLGLVAVRALSRFTAHGKLLRGEPEIARKHVIMIGVSRLSALYMKFLDAIAPGAHEIIAVLDDAADSWGRSVNGVRVMGPASKLESIIEEFAVHGVQADRVVAGMSPADMPDGVLAEIRHICARHNIELGFVPELFGLATSPEPEALTREQAAFEASLVVEPSLTPPPTSRSSATSTSAPPSCSSPYWDRLRLCRRTRRLRCPRGSAEAPRTGCNRAARPGRSSVTNAGSPFFAATGVAKMAEPARRSRGTPRPAPRGGKAVFRLK
jgi:hypothetical protein